MSRAFLAVDVTGEVYCCDTIWYDVILSRLIWSRYFLLLVKCRVRVHGRSGFSKYWCYRDDQHSSEILSARGVQIHSVPNIFVLVTFARSCIYVGGWEARDYNFKRNLLNKYWIICWRHDGSEPGSLRAFIYAYLHPPYHCWGMRIYLEYK